jgi:hypothetical protein
VTDISICNRICQMLTRAYRYTNTLLVSLNNRIYFRDHPSPGVHIMSDDVVGSDQSRRHFTTVGSTTHTAIQDDNYVLKTISHTIDLEKGKSDGVSISSDPRCQHSATTATMRF